MELLDRVFLSQKCHDQFPSAYAQILPRYVSDHAPILVYTEMDRPAGRKPFRFERFWFEYPDLQELVVKVWRERINASPMGRIHQKLWRLQHNLRCWSNSRIGDLPKKVAEAHGSLDSLLQQDQDPSLLNVPLGHIRAATNKLTALERQLEIFWAQRSHQKWIVEGDRNTRYFQAKVHRRRAYNRIERIRSMDGSMITNSRIFGS
ncbi:hypothetical protein QJS10_CPA06g00238 [Acorus calamus]|uniref:Reverse transcriptase n=1 Tax=Acorus calamus TaxID=4465 RepID=A0AAV9ENG0_ACOCL|nr:hypothetical protein QJS10_CPA06g00238 [Acorus calamus]